jgi:predicted transcriptional regulator
MRWFYARTLRATDPQLREVVRSGVLGQDSVAECDRTRRNIAPRLRTAQQYEQRFTGRHAFEGETGSHKRHRADIGSDIQRLIGLEEGGRAGLGHDWTVAFSRNIRCETGRLRSIWSKSRGRKGRTMTDTLNQTDVLGLTAQIVSAHVSNNSISPDALTALIQEVYRTLSGVGKEPAQPEKPQPAVPIKKSVFPDHIICLEDGKKLKMLKRHLKTAYNMSPEQYRERWGLAPDYPMVAPNYARHRSSLAKKIGLGTKPRNRK